MAPSIDETAKARASSGRTMTAIRLRLRWSAANLSAEARAEALADGLPADAAEAYAIGVGQAYLRGAAEMARCAMEDAARRHVSAQDALHMAQIAPAGATGEVTAEADLRAIRQSGGGVEPFALARAFCGFSRLFGGRAA
jgi:hypothetical protein